MKKSYNPLYMFGSWIGAGIVVYNYFREAYTWGVSCPKLNFVADATGNLFCSGSSPQISIFGLPFMPALLFYSVMTVSGFLIGWGIHSLFRRFWK